MILLILQPSREDPMILELESEKVKRITEFESEKCFKNSKIQINERTSKSKTMNLVT